jgi:hypothetical protein
MKMKTFFSIRTVAGLILTGVLGLLSSGSALACAACYNPAGSEKMTNAAAVGIFAMVVIMFLMLGAVAGFGFYLAYRAKHPLPDYQELLGDHDVQPNPGTAS